MPGSGKAEEKQCYWVVTGRSGVSTASSVFLSVSAECMKGACLPAILCSRASVVPALYSDMMLW